MRTVAPSLSIAFLLIAGLGSASSDALAKDPSPFRLLGESNVDGGSASLQVIPVGIGPGWRGWSWYPSSSRPVAPYYGSANNLYGYSATSVREFNYYHRSGHGQAYRSQPMHDSYRTLPTQEVAPVAAPEAAPAPAPALAPVPNAE